MRRTDFGRIRTFTAGGDLYGCLTDVGRAYRLETGALRARSAAPRRALFGFGDWVGHPVRSASGERRVRATDLRTGARHGAGGSDAVTALVVNGRGAVDEGDRSALRAPWVGPRDRPRLPRAREGRGLAVTWRVGGEQRSSSISCSQP